MCSKVRISPAAIIWPGSATRGRERLLSSDGEAPCNERTGREADARRACHLGPLPILTNDLSSQLHIVAVDHEDVTRSNRGMAAISMS
jgi:hypothetical protein